MEAGDGAPKTTKPQQAAVRHTTIVLFTPFKPIPSADLTYHKVSSLSLEV